MRDETPLQPKLIYLARRNPRLSRGEFVARWRQHGALGMSLPRWRNVARYVHCDVLDCPDSAVGLDAGYDGVGLIWHRSPQARAAHVADMDSRLQMERDELETFAGPIAETCLVAHETVLLAPPRPATAAVSPFPTPGVAKLIRFLCAREPSMHAAAPERVASDAGSRRDALAAAGSPVLGHVIDEPLPPEGSPGWGLRCHSIEELWFASEAAARRAATSLAAAHVAALTVITNDVPLYED